MLERATNRRRETDEAESDPEIPDRRLLQKDLKLAIRGFTNGAPVENPQSVTPAVSPETSERFPAARGAGGSAIRHVASAPKESLEKPTSKIRIFMFREADGSEEGLSQTGVDQVSMKVKTVQNPHTARGLHGGSAAAEETARRAMRGKPGKYSAPEHLFETARPHLQFDQRLSVEMKSSAGLQIAKAREENRLLEWIVQESDAYVLDQHDKVGGSYSRMAANIARMIKAQLARADGWDMRARSNRLARPEQENYWAADSGITEAFLAKVIQKTSGTAHRNKFIAALGNNGFEPTEGFEVAISNFKGKKVIDVLFKKIDKTGESVFSFRQRISPELLDKIIEEETELKQTIEQSGKAPEYDEAAILEQLSPKKKRTRRRAPGILGDIAQGTSSD